MRAIATKHIIYMHMEARIGSGTLGKRVYIGTGKIKEKRKVVIKFRTMMQSIRVAVFESKPYDEESFLKQRYNGALNFEFVFVKERLDTQTVDLYTTGVNAVCCFVNSYVSREIQTKLKAKGIGLILLRCAGFDNVDLDAARELGLSVARVPVYSPYAVAEFAATLLMALNRKIHKAYNRTRDCNYTLSGLVGVDLHGKTAGVVGTGKIGRCFIDIALGFGCKILAYDVFQSEELKANPNVTYVTLDELFKHSDIISLHAPLTKETTHLINERTLSLMKKSCLLVNTSRGKLVDTKALVKALEEGRISGAAVDVYENEQQYFFSDFSTSGVNDEILVRLQSNPKAIVTSHQAFLTEEALEAIALTTFLNCKEYFEEKKIQKQMSNTVL